MLDFVHVLHERPVSFCEKLRHSLFNFRIRKFKGDILRHMPMECQKVVKLSEGPDPGLSYVY